MKIRLLGWAFMAISFLASCSDEEIVADVKLPKRWNKHKRKVWRAIRTVSRLK